MKRSATAATFLIGGLLAATPAPVAAAEGTTTPARLITVQGIGSAPVAQDASLTEADAAYRQAMSAAIIDGQGKAEFLAGKVGAGLGAVQSIAEEGGSISCSGAEPSSYVEYEGAQPDFGFADLRPPLVAASSAPVRGAPVHGGPASGKHKPKLGKRSRAHKHGRRARRGRHLARKAGAITCTLSAAVAISWMLA